MMPFRFKLIVFLYSLLFGLGLSSAFSSPSRAATITPSDVYQTTETVRLRLQSLGLLSEKDYLNATPEIALRHPRHVIQKVRECDMIIKKLLYDRKIAAAPIPDLISFREVRPVDVDNGVRHLLKEISKLGADEKIVAPVQSNKLPNDVYNNLDHICHAIPAQINASDTYQIAKAVFINIEKISKARGYNIEIEPQSYATQLPEDVYKAAWGLQKDLRELALIPDFSIPGGVVLAQELNKKDASIRDSISLLNDALAETEAIKYTLNIGEQSTLPPLVQDKTSSDVYQQIRTANKLVMQMIALEQAEDNTE